MKIDVAQLGARMHYAVPAFFAKEQLLNYFYTDLWREHVPFAPFMNVVPKIKRLGNRSHPLLTPDKVKSFTSLGFRYAFALQSAQNREQETDLFLKFSELFQGKVLQQNHGLKAPDVLYAFNSVSKKLFLSKFYSTSHKVLEQTLVPRFTENDILRQEYDIYGQKFIAGKKSDSYSILEIEENRLADLILVGSEFVKNSLVDLKISPEKIVVVPYGYSGKIPTSLTPKPSSNTLKVLFIGNGGIRKGIRYAIEAVQEMTHCSLTIAGKMEEEIPQKYASESIQFLGSVPSEQIPKLMQSHDVLLLPSLCEGSATVSYEAMAYGLPVICTPNAGTVVQHNKEGWIIPIRSSQAIKDVLVSLLDEPEKLAQAREEALKTAQLNTMEAYGKRLVRVIKERFEPEEESDN